MESKGHPRGLSPSILHKTENSSRSWLLNPYVASTFIDDSLTIGHKDALDPCQRPQTNDIRRPTLRLEVDG